MTMVKTALPAITLTGVDAQTDLSAVDDLAIPGVEFGVLLSAHTEGRPRYPTIDMVEQVVQRLGLRSAVHICGQAARSAMLSGQYDQLLRATGRIQVNGMLSPNELRQVMLRFPGKPIITQVTRRNSELTDFQPPSNVMDHMLLRDNSGGLGIVPERWELIDTPKATGFAGGLGPDNLGWMLVHRILPIAEHLSDLWWVDMESKLRDTHDRFSLTAAASCIQLVRALQMHRFPS